MRTSRVHLAGKNRGFAALRNRLLDKFARLPARGDGADERELQFLGRRGAAERPGRVARVFLFVCRSRAESPPGTLPGPGAGLFHG